MSLINADVISFNKKNEIEVVGEDPPPCLTCEAIGRTLVEIANITLKVFLTTVVVAACVVAWPVTLSLLVVTASWVICDGGAHTVLNALCESYFIWMSQIDSFSLCGVVLWDVSPIVPDMTSIDFKTEMVLVPSDGDKEFNDTLAGLEGKYLQLNAVKSEPIDFICLPYADPQRGIYGFDRDWPDGDFTTPGLKQDIVKGWLHKIEQYSDPENSSTLNEAIRYFDIILNVLEEYKSLDDDGYKEYFNIVMLAVKVSLEQCPANQIAVLRDILCEALVKHPSLAKLRSFEDLQFAVALCRYQEYEVRKAVSKHIRESRAEVGKPQKEDTELEFVVKRELAISYSIGKAHFFETSNRNVVNSVKQTFIQEYRPLRYLMSGLTEDHPEERLTASFHRQICRWFGEQGVDLEEKGYRLSPRAVLYFMIQNNLLIEVQ